MESKASEVTSSSSLKSRKRQEEDSTETPPSKKLKTNEDETSGPDFSKLPVEVLEIICKYVDKESRQALGETCKVLFLLSVPQVLRLDFDRIQNESFPIVNRAHQEVRLVGEKVRGTTVQFNNSFQSPRSSVKTLSIGEGLNFQKYGEDAPRHYRTLPDVRRYGTQLSFQRFQFLLEHFPNLTTVELRGVSIKVGKVIKSLELPKLKILLLENIENDVLAAFKQVKTLEELHIGKHGPASSSLILEFIYAQKDLVSINFHSLDSGSFSYYDQDYTPLLKLRKITSVCRFHYFRLAPNLEDLILNFDGEYGEYESDAAHRYLKTCHSTKLKTLILNLRHPERDFVEELRPNFPMLKN